jgi:hypothetical protein
MTTFTHTQAAPRMTHLRAYLAGTGATGALIGGAIVVFLSLAAFVTFKGMPFGASGDNQGSTYLGSNAGSSAVGAPRAAAAALRAGPGAVAAAAASGASGGGAGGASDAPPAGFAPPGGSIDPTDPSSPITSPTSPTPPTVSSDTDRAVTGTVQALGQATGTDLPGQTSGATRQLDDEVNGALDGVGGAVGNPRLGDDVGGAVNGLTGSGN